MRLSDRKIEVLADKVLRWLESQSDVELLEETGTIHAAVVDEFQKEKELERQLDDDVDRILQENEQRMRTEGVDSWVMRKKVRAQLARERGLVL
jgi:hypothetical protein